MKNTYTALRRTLSIMLVFVMIFTSMPTGAIAETTLSPGESQADVAQPLQTPETPAAQQAPEAPQTPETPQPPSEPAVYTVSVYYLYEDDTTAVPFDSRQYEAGQAYSFAVPALAGYTAYVDNAPYTAAAIEGTASADATYTVVYKAGDMAYTVVHKTEQLDGTYASETETLTGKTGSQTEAQAKIMPGFTAQEFEQKTLAAGAAVTVEITYLRDTQYVNYNTSGGSYVERQSAKYGATVAVTTAVPTKAGFTFGGWYTDAALTQPAPAEVVLNGNVTLYAKWQGRQVSYTVVTWLENADDAEYSYASTDTSRTATAGTTVTLTAADVPAPAYFTFGRSETAVINADGSTIINVYFTRNQYTLTFTGEKLVCTRTHKHSSKCYQEINHILTAKYDANIGARWNAIVSQYPGSVWESSATQDYYTFLEKMPSKNLTLTKTDWTGTTNTWYYYLETLSGTAPNGEPLREENGKIYYLYNTCSIEGSWSLNLTYKEDYFPITGFMQRDKEVPNFNWSVAENARVAYLYYTRSSFDLSFYNYNTTIKTENLKYQAPLAAHASFVPSRPTGLPAYYTFQGWYTTQGCVEGTQINFASATMPAKNLIVYAKWAAPTYTFTFETEDGTAISSQTITAGGVASHPADPEKTGYVFEGWYTDLSYATEYDFSKPVTGNTIIYAKWRALTSTTYTVQYLHQGDNAVVYAPVTYSGRVGSTVYVPAKSHTQYVADASSKTMVLQADPADNILTFWYTQPSALGYTVRFEDAQGNLLAGPFAGTTNLTQIVVQASSYTLPTGYRVDTPTKTLRLQSNAAANVVVFSCTPVSYVIRYNLDGGTVSGTNPASYQITSPAITLVNPTREGYVFEGWTGTGLSGATKQVVIATGSTGDRSYTATWSRQRVTVSYVAAAGGSVSPASETLNFGDTAQGAAATPANGYYFEKWTDADGNTVSTAATFAPANVRANATYTAHFAAKTAVTVAAGNLTKTYDGTPLVADSSKVTATGLPAGYVCETTTYVTAGVINVGDTGRHEVASVVIRKDGADVTGRFSITKQPGTLGILPRSITVTGNSRSVAYNKTQHTVTGVTAGNLLEGHTISCEAATASGTNVGTYRMGLTAASTFVVKNGSQNVTANYQVTAVTDGVLTITPKATKVVVTANNLQKVYGDADPTFTATVTGLEDGDTLHYSLERTAGENVGTYEIRVVLGSNPNYTVEPHNGTLTITKKSLTLKADNKTKVYGDANPALTVTATGLANNDTLANLQYELRCSATAHAGNYPITVVPGENPNYTVSVEEGLFIVQPRPVTVTAVRTGKVYGETDPTLTATVLGLVGEDTLTYSVTRAQGENAGEYNMTVAVQPNDNYAPVVVPGTFTISPKAVTLTADNKTMVYGDAQPALTATAEGLAAGDTSLAYDIARVPGNDKGTYLITVTPKENANYIVTPRTGTFTILPREATVTVASATKTYGNEEPVYTAGVQNLAGTDALQYTFVRTPGEDVGTYSINAVVTPNKNYTVTVVPGTLQIVPRPITVTGNSRSVVYTGTPQTVTGVTAANLLSGHTIECDAATATGTNAGTYNMGLTKQSAFAVKQGNVDVTRNYTVDAVTDGSLTIAPKEVNVIVAANNQQKVYGEDDPKFTATVTGTENGEDLQYTLERDLGEEVNTYAIRVVLGNNPNYKVATQGGTFTIVKKPVTLTVDNKTKTYGETDPTLTATVTGLVDDDTLEYSLAREAGSDAGTYDLIATLGNNPNYDVTTAQGSFTILPKPVTLTARNDTKMYGSPEPALQADVAGLVGTDTLEYKVARVAGENAGKYTIGITVTPHNNYVPTVVQGEFTITKKAATLQADNNGKVYGAAEPTLTATATGTIGTETLAYNVTRQPGKDVGTYDITVQLLENPNYDITLRKGIFTISPKEAHITVADASKIYGSNDPASFTVTTQGTVNNETLAYTVARAKGENVGTYSIVVTPGVNKNYAITVHGGTFSITPKAITLQADNKTKVYGAAEPRLTATATGLKSGDALDYTLKREAGSNVGIYAITLQLGTNPNYTITPVNGALTITPKTATLRANDADKVYGETDPTLTARASGLVGKDKLAYTVTRAPGENAGTYTISVVPGENPNYSVTIQTGTFTIYRKWVVLKANDATKVYGDADPTFTATVTGLVGDDTLHYTLARRAGETIGLYAVQATPGSNPNYRVSTVSGVFSITRRPVTLRVHDATKFYGDKDPAFTATVENLAFGDTLLYTLQRHPGQQLGQYPITAFYVPNVNYNVIVENGTLHIVPRTDLTYTVKYVDEANNKLLDAKTVSGQTQNSTVKEAAPAITGYVPQKTEQTLTLSADKANVLTFVYDVDAKGKDPATTGPNEPLGDGIADKYQTIFTYVSAGNGSVSGTAFELHTFTDAQGNYMLAQPVSPRAQVSVSAAAGYAFDFWTDGTAARDMTVGMTQLKAKQYAADTVFTVQFAVDELVDPTKDKDPETPGDGVPDQYQAVVTYRAVNGQVSLDKTVVTLYNAEGFYAKDGTGYLAQSQIAQPTPAVGFKAAASLWAPATPAVDYAIRSNTEFVASFVKNENDTKDVTYTVEHYKDGTLADTDRITVPVWIGGPSKVTVTTVAQKAYPNYLFLRSDTALPAELAGDSVVRMYYALDENGPDTTDPTDKKPDGIPDADEFSITYVANNGTAVKYTDPALYPAQHALRLSSNMFSYSGYTFTGWLGQNNVLYTAGAQLTVTGNMVLTAQWAAVPVTPVTPPVTPTRPVRPVTPVTPVVPEVEETIPEEEAALAPAPAPATEEAEPEAALATIEDASAPKAAGAAWALLNLILMLCTAFACILLLVGLLGKKKETDATGETLYTIKRKAAVRVLSVLPAIGSIVAFFLTENLRNPMVFADRWTWLMVVIALVQLIVCLLARKHSKEDGQNTQKPLQA